MKQWKERLLALLKQTRDLAAKAEGEDRDFTEDERTQIKSWADEAKDLKSKVDAQAENAALVKQIQDLGAGVELTGPKAEEAVKAAAVDGRREKSVGQRFAEAPEYQEWIKRVAPSGQIPESLKGLASPSIQFKSLLTGASDVGGGAMVFNDVQQGIIPLARRPLTMRSIVTPGTTSSDTIEYVKVTSETNNAAVVAEATATGGSSGVKPESAMALVKVTEPVKTIAHWIPATRRALSDAGQLRTIIDNFLRDGLEQALETEMVSGDGTGEHFTGLEHLSGVQTQAFVDDIFTTARKARTKARTIGRVVPTAYLMNPNDWEVFDLAQDNTARFFGAGPFALSVPRLWSLPVVECEAVTEGTAWVGDFKKLVLWDREQASVMVTDSHADNFIRNILVFLAEMRAAYGCLQPSAFVQIDLTA